MKSNTKLKKNNIACDRWHTMSFLQQIITTFKISCFLTGLIPQLILHKKNALTLPKFGKTETVQ